MKILTVAEHYPSPFKAYHDAQFERFVLDGHDLAICAFGFHEGELNPAVRCHRLHERTTYLPLTLKDLPKTIVPVLGSLLASPRESLARITTVIKTRPSLKRGLLDCVRAVLLPRSAPSLCIVHNLRALVHAHVIRVIYPDTVIAFYFHGGEVPGVPSPDAREVVRAFALTDVVFTNTESSKEHAIERGCDPDKVFVSPVGFNFDYFPDPIGRSYRSEGKLNVLMAGRISNEKGIMIGIRAFQIARQERGLDARLRIVGDGPLMDQLRTFVADHGLESDVEILGRQSQERLYEEYRRADVFVLPSVKVGNWEENQACVVQEAMLMRAVVAVSRTGGVPESTAPEMLAYSFEPGDVEGLVDSLLKVAQLSEEALRELGAKGRAFVEQRYDIRRLNAELIEVAMQRGRFRSC